MTPRQRLIVHLIGMGAVLCAGGICCGTAAILLGLKEGA